jgi:hypothetical protein
MITQNHLGSPMRRYMMLVVGLAALLGGCSMFSAHSDVIEEASGQKFTSERLADILTRIKQPMAYDTKTGTFVTAFWTDITLFAQAAAANKLTTDSTFIAEAMWPVIAQATATRWVDTVLAQRAKITDAAIDSAYKADQLRSVQHILIKADSAGPKELKEIARRKADALLAQLKGGASFSKLAVENTDDPGSKADSGFYGPEPKGHYVPSFEKAEWSLAPGEMSGVVTTVYGYHILRRPTLKESTRFWRDTLSQRVADPIMKAYYDELGKDYDVKVDPAAVPHIRAAIDDLQGHAEDKTALTTFKGGSFTTAEFVRWINAATADPSRAADFLPQVKIAADSEIVKIAQAMTQSALLLKEAEKHHIAITSVEWNQLRDGFKDAIDTLKATIGLVPPDFDPKASESDRSKVAAKKVDEYFNALVEQKKPLRALPGILAATLQSHDHPKFNAVALQRGLDMAKAQHAADSAKAFGPGNPAETAPLPGALKPAPGGPPVGGAEPIPPPAPKKP